MSFINYNRDYMQQLVNVNINGAYHKREAEFDYRSRSHMTDLGRCPALKLTTNMYDLDEC